MSIETYVVTLLATFMLVFPSSSTHHYEKFFEIDGGPQYMYYFSKFYVGTPSVEQSAIIDTGSDTLAFPCDHCQGSNCGTHQDPRFISGNSKTFSFDMRCSHTTSYHKHQVCQFVKTYAEGSSLLGFLADDYVKFKDSRRVVDSKLSRLNSQLKNDLRMKAEFGCTTKETGLFKSQYADGILGLDNDSTLMTSIERMNGNKDEKIFSFGLCFHNTGGIMSVDLRNKNRPDDKITMLNKKINEYKNPLVVRYSNDSNYYEITSSRFSIGKNGKTLIPLNDLGGIRMMIDSGTTFSHFPDRYMNRILDGINTYCRKSKNRCGMIPNPHFKEDSCLELRQPDDNYKNEYELLDSFPDIQIHFGSNKRPYIIKPRNYFYKEYLDPSTAEPNLVRLCMAIKGHEDRKIILGAFSMIDHYFYFDRKSKNIKIFNENCYLRTTELLMKRERLLSESVNELVNNNGLRVSVTVLGLASLSLYFINRYNKKAKYN